MAIAMPVSLLSSLTMVSFFGTPEAHQFDSSLALHRRPGQVDFGIGFVDRLKSQLGTSPLIQAKHCIALIQEETNTLCIPSRIESASQGRVTSLLR